MRRWRQGWLFSKNGKCFFEKEKFAYSSIEEAGYGCDVRSNYE